MSNVCVRSITRHSSGCGGDRSPRIATASSPQPSSSSTPPHMDRRRLFLVLEQALSVLLAQALLAFSDPGYSSRDKQLLRRELGAEFGSCTESMRRFVHRGMTRSPQIGGAAGSPGGQTQSTLTKSDEQFMKFVGVIVQSVFK